jgi:VanZ family protein
MKWIAAGFAVFILAVIVLADAHLLGPLRGLYAVAYADKIGHFVLYGLLALFIQLALPARPKLWRSVLGVSLALAALIGLEEWSQSRFPSRTMDAADLLASYAGLTTFSLAAYWFRHTRRAEAPQGSNRR